MPIKYETLFKKIILDKGLSYNIVSKMTGIPKSTIGNYAIGARKPDLHSVCTIMRALQLESDLIYSLFEPVIVLN